MGYPSVLENPFSWQRLEKLCWWGLERFEPTCSIKPPFQWISVQAFKQLQQQKADFHLVDVREPYEYETYNIGGTLIPLAQLQDRLSELSINQHLILHCKSDQRSQKAVAILYQHGFNNISVLSGGILAWREDYQHSNPS